MATIELFSAAPITLQTKTLWSDSWVTNAALEPINASLDSINGGYFRFRHRYGQFRSVGGHPTGGAIPLDLGHKWFRALDGSSNIIFQGRIQNETRDIFSNPSGSSPGGIQTFTATDGFDLLRRKEFHQSVVEKSSGTALIDSNLAFAHNRSATEYSLGSGHDSYVFDSSSSNNWNGYQILRYILAVHLNTGLVDDPLWTINSGAQSILEPLEQEFMLDEVESCHSVLSKILSRDIGIGFQIRPTLAGYELFVHGLLTTAVTFGGETVAANSNSVNVNANSTVDARKIVIEENYSNVYSEIRVIGKPMKVCASFQRNSSNNRDAIPAWEAADKTSYDTSSGTTNTEKDNHRRLEKFRPVYQHWIADTDNIDTWPVKTVPKINNDGSISTTERSESDQYFSPLSYLPIFEGVDYTSTDPEFDWESADQGHMQPMAFVQDLDDNYLKAEFANCHVSVLPYQLGVEVAGPINHWIAEGQFTADTDTEPEYNLDNIAFTVAWEADERIKFVYQTGANPARSLGVKIIEVDAEVWWLAPDTIVDVDKDGALVESDSDGIIIRRDSDLILRTMAGAVARYGQPRARARIHIENFINWTQYLGYILNVINDGTTASSISGPLTAIDWQFEPNYKTTLRTGYAR